MSTIPSLLEITTEKIPEGSSFSMAKVERGVFLLNDKIQTEISSFWIGQYQVSQELWAEIMGENPSRFKGKDLPVERVSWVDIQIFLEKLNEELSLRGDCVYRLPTEAEWEYAARGGKYGLNTLYAGSKNVDKVGWYGYSKGHKETQPLGLKVPNELGLYDMSGNVWEWCQDWYEDYSIGPLKDPEGPKRGQHRVLRGGSWFVNEFYCRVSVRNRDTPDLRSSFIGFRLSRTAW